jgi:hypothetical protein
MIFETFDEFFEYIKTNNLSISDFDMSYIKEVKETPPDSETTTVEESAEKDETAVSSTPAHSSTAKILNISESPDVPVEYGDENILYVKEFNEIPNACHMGEIELFGRKLYAGICNENDKNVLTGMMLEINENEDTSVFINGNFTLKRGDTEKVVIKNSKNQI